MRKITFLICCLLCFTFAVQAQVQSSTDVEELVTRYQDLGDTEGSISQHFTLEELRLLQGYFENKRTKILPQNVTRNPGAAPLTGSGISNYKTTFNGVAGTATMEARGQRTTPQTVTHSVTQNIVAGSVTCNSGGIPVDQSFYRDYDLTNDFGITGDFVVSDVEFGVETASGPAGVALTLNIWSTPTGTFPAGALTLQGSAAYVSGAGDSGLVVSVPLSATIPAGEDMIFELAIDAGATETWFPGSNPDGQTGVSWISTVSGCGPIPITDLAALGFPDMHLVMNVVGKDGPGGGGGPVLAYGHEAVTPLGYGTLDPAAPEVFTTISAGGEGFEPAGAIDTSDPTTGYAIGGAAGDLYSFDVASGVYTNIGNVGTGWNGMDFNPVDGAAYVVSGTELHSIDVGAGTTTLVGPLGTGGALAVSFAIDGAGVGYVFDIADDNIYSVDLTTGAATLIGPAGFDGNFAQGMGWDPNTDTVYLAAFNNTTFLAEWRSLDVGTGATTLIGVIDDPNLADVTWTSLPDAGGGCSSTNYVSTDVPFAIDGGGTSTPDCTTSTNLINVDVVESGTLGTDADIENVEFSITHTFDGDLEIYLVSPAGTELLMVDQVGGSGDNFTNTVIEDGGSDITLDAPPFTGVYAPQGGTFAGTFGGEGITGTWSLKICDQFGGDSGTVDQFELNLCVPPQVDNDLCDDAFTITCGEIVFGDTSTATDTGGNPAPDRWYSFTGSGTPEVITVATCGAGTDYDTWLRAFTDCTQTNEIASNDDSCGLQSEISFVSDGVSTYYIMVEGFSSSSGNYELELTCAPVDEDVCEGAISMNCGDTVTGNTSGFTTDSGDGCGTSITSPGVWYTFTDTFGFPSDYTVSLCDGGTDYDSKLSVYTGDCSNLVCVAGIDDFCGLQSEVSFTGDGTQTYYILVHGFGGATGNYSLNVECTPIPPPNDLIVNSIDMDEIGFPYTDPAVVLPAATVEGGNPVDCNIDGANGVWYNFTPDTAGPATAEIVNPAGTSVVIWFKAPDENATETDLTRVDQFDNQCLPSTSSEIIVNAGQAYYLFVVNTGDASDVVVNTDTVLDISEVGIEGFTFYPNPARDAINMNAADNIEQATIFNLLGQVVVDQSIDATSGRLNVANLAIGTYIMKVTVNGQVGTYKIIKQ